MAVSVYNEKGIVNICFYILTKFALTVQTFLIDLYMTPDHGHLMSNYKFKKVRFLTLVCVMVSLTP